MRIVVECPKCGHEREVDRDDLIGGDWRHKPCPVCEAPSNEPTEDERNQTP
jgi:endogenous inhibitor of DNA gyrase (YacG/DUF329 family)